MHVKYLIISRCKHIEFIQQYTTNMIKIISVRSRKKISKFLDTIVFQMKLKPNWKPINMLVVAS